MIPLSVIKMVRELDHPGIHNREKENIIDALTIADEYGYGNMMAWLATAWAVKLRDQGLSDEAAIDAVSHRTPYGLPPR